MVVVVVVVVELENVSKELEVGEVVVELDKV